jgi:hypothetical protein
VLFDLKKKDEIQISECDVTTEPKLGLSENNKYMFSVSYKTKNMFGITRLNKLTLGTDSD